MICATASRAVAAACSASASVGVAFEQAGRVRLASDVCARELDGLGEPDRPGHQRRKGQPDHHRLHDDVGIHEHAPGRQVARQQRIVGRGESRCRAARRARTPRAAGFPVRPIVASMAMPAAWRCLREEAATRRSSAARHGRSRDPLGQRLEPFELILPQRARLVAADEHLEHDAAIDIEEGDERRRFAHERPLDKGDRRRNARGGGGHASPFGCIRLK